MSGGKTPVVINGHPIAWHKRRKNAVARLYWVWAAMLKRCRNPTDPAFHNYGGRGIRVCRRWHSFANFFLDVGVCPSPGLTVERKNSRGHYELSNVCWATRLQQNNNRPTWCKIIEHRGIKGTMKEVWRATAHPQVTYRAFVKRLNRNWSIGRALTQL